MYFCWKSQKCKTCLSAENVSMENVKRLHYLCCCFVMFRQMWTLLYYIVACTLWGRMETTWCHFYDHKCSIKMEWYCEETKSNFCWRLHKKSRSLNGWRIWHLRPHNNNSFLLLAERGDGEKKETVRINGRKWCRVVPLHL